MSKNSNNFISDLLENPPLLDYYDNCNQSCGFDKNSLLYLDSSLKEYGYSLNIPKVIQTGAGASTLWFLGKGVELHTFCNNEIINKINLYLCDYQINYNWFPHAGKTKLTLPNFCLNRNNEFGVALIDGEHSFINVFSEFYYLNQVLSHGSLIFIDDIQLPGPFALCRYLDIYNEDYKFCSVFGKTKLYIKLSTSDNFNPIREIGFFSP